MSLGTGRPIVLRDENTIRHCRVLLTHRLASPTDVRLIALVELIAQKSILILPILQILLKHLQHKSMKHWHPSMVKSTTIP
jgi:hypothetical protein